MKRIRLVALVSTLCVCLVLFATGVWAIASTVIFNLSGNLKFYPEGVYVELSGQVYRGDSESSLQPITSDTRFTLDPQTNFDNTAGEPSGNFPISSWNIGGLPFAPQLRYIKIEVRVKNYSDFDIIGTLELTGAVTTNSNITITNSGSVYVNVGETKIYELIFKLNDGAQEITEQDIEVSFNFSEAVINYTLFEYETEDGLEATSETGTVIAGFNTTNYTSETAPTILIIPAHNENGDLLTIKSSAFNSSTLNSPIVILQNGITSIPDYAFRLCSKMISITIPESVTSIGDHAFWNCSGLSSLTIPESVTSIGDEAFRYCSKLTSISIPNGVTSIPSYAFGSCSNLTSVIIPESVTNIDGSAFYLCDSLTSITIPESVTSIGSSAFYGCSSLKYIHLLGNLTSVYSLSGTWQYSATELTTPTFSNTTSRMQNSGWYYQQSAWN